MTVLELRRILQGMGCTGVRLSAVFAHHDFCTFLSSLCPTLDRLDPRAQGSRWETTYVVFKELSMRLMADEGMLTLPV